MIGAVLRRHLLRVFVAICGTVSITCCCILGVERLLWKMELLSTSYSVGVCHAETAIEKGQVSLLPRSSWGWQDDSIQELNRALGHRRHVLSFVFRAPEWTLQKGFRDGYNSKMRWHLQGTGEGVNGDRRSR